MQRARNLGDYILGQLNITFGKLDYIKEIRGSGLLIGIEMAESCPELVPLAQSQGLLINVTQDKVIRLLPPLIMSDQEATYLVENLTKLIRLYAGDDRKYPR